MGRSFTREIDFSTGMTNIVGPNESGKSFTFEIIEFLLFGSAALRGKADDYKHLKASGFIRIRGARYHIERTARNAALSLAAASDDAPMGNVLAVGTKPVNARLLATLGYGLDVFRVANIANQGDAQRLSRMLPRERKAMVDKLIGADQLEKLALWCGDQALSCQREITGMEAGLIEPVEPVKPEGYRPAAHLRSDIDQLRSARNKAVELRAFLANEPAVPERGDQPTFIPLEKLERADQVLGLRTYDFDLAEVERQHDAYSTWEARGRFVERYFPQPELTQEQCEIEIKAQGLIRDIARLAASPTILCPCGKPFTTADAELARVRQELWELERPDLSVLKNPSLDLQLQALRRWHPDGAVALDWERLKDVPEAPRPAQSLHEAKGAVHIAAVRDELHQLGVDGMSRDQVRRLAADLRAWQAQEAAVAGAQARREAWEAEAATARSTLHALPDTAALNDLEALLAVVQVYEAAVVDYGRLKAAYDERVAVLVELRAERDSWKDGKAGVNEVREDTKTFLAPAMSRVASHMMDQMTGGKRSRIVIDEDFGIEVDGQDLATLSGSAKVCANLAVRLGLGRILTNGVFPVFLGDEMDESMDEDRAGHFHAALANLQEKFTQIVVITHKQPTVSQVIKFGE